MSALMNSVSHYLEYKDWTDVPLYNSKDKKWVLEPKTNIIARYHLSLFQKIGNQLLTPLAKVVKWQRKTTSSWQRLAARVLVFSIGFFSLPVLATNMALEQLRSRGYTLMHSKKSMRNAPPIKSSRTSRQRTYPSKNKKVVFLYKQLLLAKENRNARTIQSMLKKHNARNGFQQAITRIRGEQQLESERKAAVNLAQEASKQSRIIDRCRTTIEKFQNSDQTSTLFHTWRLNTQERAKTRFNQELDEVRETIYNNFDREYQDFKTNYLQNSEGKLFPYCKKNQERAIFDKRNFLKKLIKPMSKRQVRNLGNRGWFRRHNVPSQGDLGSYLVPLRSSAQNYFGPHVGLREEKLPDHKKIVCIEDFTNWSKFKDEGFIPAFTKFMLNKFPVKRPVESNPYSEVCKKNEEQLFNDLKQLFLQQYFIKEHDCEAVYLKKRIIKVKLLHTLPSFTQNTEKWQFINEESKEHSSSESKAAL